MYTKDLREILETVPDDASLVVRLADKDEEIRIRKVAGVHPRTNMVIINLHHHKED